MSATLALPAAKLALNAVGSIANTLSEAARAKAKKQADDFETVFLEQFTQQVTATPQGSEGPLGENGIGGDIYKSQLTQEYAKQIQKAGGIGLSDAIMRDLIRTQEQSAATAGSSKSQGIGA